MYNRKINSRTQYLQQDLRHIIELFKISTSNGFNNDGIQRVVNSFKTNAFIQDIEPIETIHGSSVQNATDTNNITHIFVIRYFPLYVDLLTNTRAWNLKYENQIYTINTATQINNEKRFIKIKTTKKVSS